MMLKRFSVSLDARLLDQFDRYINIHQYNNRSEAIRNLIRKELTNNELHEDIQVIGVITLIYRYRHPKTYKKATEIQHTFHSNIVSSTHVHMNKDNCIEVIIVRGKAGQVRQLADRLIALRGIRDGNLTMSCAGKALQ